MDKEQFRSLPEKLKRLILGQEAIEIGKGGVSQVAKKYDVSRTTVTKGKKEYLAGEKYSSETGSRKKGGGRKLITEKNPEITTLIIEMIEKENGVYGDPMTERRWTTLSTRKIARYLKKDHGIDISSSTVRRILKINKISRQQNRKMKGTGKPDPDRDKQFKHIVKMRKFYLTKGWAVISIDAKKKELIGEFKSNGSEYRLSKSARKVNDHDFGEQRVTPYGIYDYGRNKGFINLGNSSDTAEFAVESIRRWWYTEGSSAYPGCKHILIPADNGGSNGSNRRMFKKYLSDLSKETGLIFYVCHYPSGTSKYNPIEHRLFSEISKSIQAQRG